MLQCVKKYAENRDYSEVFRSAQGGDGIFHMPKLYIETHDGYSVYDDIVC